MSFHPGQRVRCIAQGVWRREGVLSAAAALPEFGRVYVVVRIVLLPSAVDGAKVEFLKLAGVCPAPAFERAVFRADHFRPLEDDQIEALRALAASPRVGERSLVEGLVSSE